MTLPVSGVGVVFLVAGCLWAQPLDLVADLEDDGPTQRRLLTALLAHARAIPGVSVRRWQPGAPLKGSERLLVWGEKRVASDSSPLRISWEPLDPSLGSSVALRPPHESLLAAARQFFPGARRVGVLGIPAGKLDPPFLPWDTPGVELDSAVDLLVCEGGVEIATVRAALRRAAEMRIPAVVSASWVPPGEAAVRVVPDESAAVGWIVRTARRPRQEAGPAPTIPWKIILDLDAWVRSSPAPRAAVLAAADEVWGTKEDRR